jgi:probable rRNA maturation factor
MRPIPISIANRHPRLRLDRRAIVRAVHILDAHAHVFTPTFVRSARRNSKIEIQKSKIPTSLPVGELSLVFLTDAALAKLHADFLANPMPTDVITFAGSPVLGLSAGAGLAGEICVSVDAAARHVLSRSRTRKSLAVGRRRGPPKSHDFGYASATAFSAELTLYLVHGWLHLAGYDDLAPTKKRAMRRAEARAMRLLRTNGCLPIFTLTDW